ncbi:MAG: AbrB/MazE/SpoVT family DNA-binding domain-containing protein [Oscillospiraceae bacterium]|nr:AbrB/MazE/SpoVT family DNA-binding domain-containing protein [Oscillospiraceae bacterium]
MKGTGIFRRIDSLGRFVLPKEMRKTLNINQDDYLQIFLEGDNIILRKSQQKCIICDVEETIQEPFREFHGKKICKNCLETLKNL